jgi:hypothetical protein
VDHYFANLPGRVRWANAHPRQAEDIAANAVAFYRRYLRQRGTVAYTRVLFTEYAKRMGYAPRLREGALPVEQVLNRPRWRYDHCNDPAQLPFFANYSVGSVPFGEVADDGDDAAATAGGAGGVARRAVAATTAATVVAKAAAPSPPPRTPPAAAAVPSPSQLR